LTALARQYLAPEQAATVIVGPTSVNGMPARSQ